MNSRLEGREIKCPICGDEKVRIRLNKKGRPVVTCQSFGSAMNFNTEKGEEFIKELVQESEEEPYKSGQESKEDNDDWL